MFVEGMAVPGKVTEFAFTVRSIAGVETPILVVFVKTDEGTVQHDYFVDERPFKGSTSRAESLRRISDIVGADVPWSRDLHGLVGAKCSVVPGFVSTKSGGFWKATYLNPLVRGAMSENQLDLLFGGAPKSSNRDMPVDNDHGNTPGIDPQSEEDDLPEFMRTDPTKPKDYTPLK